MGSSWGAEHGWCECRNEHQLCPAKLSSAASQGQAQTSPGKPLLAPSQLCSGSCPLSAWLADGCHLCGLCLGVSQAWSPPCAHRRSEKASQAVLGLLPSHLWAQPGRKEKRCAGEGRSQMPSQGLREVMGRRLLHVPGGPGQRSLAPSLALGQGTWPGLCMRLVWP